MKKIRYITLSIILITATIFPNLLFDTTTLPFGWEIPKVRFLQLWGIVTIISLCIIHYFDLAFRYLPTIIFKSKKFKVKSLPYYIRSYKTWLLPIRRKRATEVVLRFKPLTFGLLLMILFSVGSLQSEVPTKFTSGKVWFNDKFPEVNKLYERLDFLPDLQALFGNIFREQGLITMLVLLIAFLFISYSLKELSKRFYFQVVILTLIAILIASVLNSIEAIRQTSLYLIENPSRLTEGRWVFGYFGQTNFYVGHQILGVLSGMQLFVMVNFTKLRSGKKIDNSYEIAIKTLLLIAVFTIVVSILPTFSTWGIGIAFGAVGLFMMQFLQISRQGDVSPYPTNRTIKFPKRAKLVKALNDNVDEDVVLFLKKLENFRFITTVNYLRSKLFSITYVHLCTMILILCTLTLLPFMSWIRHYMPDQQHRINIWQGVYESYIANPIENKEYEILLFGSGFDNLGEQLRSDNFLPQHYIDRAHNLPLDVLASTGIIGISLFVVLVLLSYRRMWRYDKSISSNQQLQRYKSMNRFLAAALTVLLTRSLIHTNSIMNIVHIGIVLVLIWGINTKKEGELE